MAPSLKTHVIRSCDSLILRRDFERRLRDIVGAKTLGQETAQQASVFEKKLWQRLRNYNQVVINRY
jgi:primosomal protein N''